MKRVDQLIGFRMGTKQGSGYGAIGFDRVALRRKMSQEIAHDRRHHRFVQRHPVIGESTQLFDHECRVPQELVHGVRIQPVALGSDPVREYPVVQGETDLKSVIAKGLKNAAILLDRVPVEMILLRFDACPFDAQAEPFVRQFRHEGMILFVAVPVIHGAARDRLVHDQPLLFPGPPVRKCIAALDLVASA